MLAVYAKRLRTCSGLTSCGLRTTIAVAHDLIWHVIRVLLQMYRDTAVEESSLLCDDTQFVIRLEGADHPDAQEHSGHRCKHWIEMRVDLVPDVAHEIKTDYWQCGNGWLARPHQAKASGQGLQKHARQQYGVRRSDHNRILALCISRDPTEFSP